MKAYSRNSDIIAYAKLEKLYRVRFIVNEDDSLSQYFSKQGGETIGTMPENPFVEGKIFEGWFTDPEDDSTRVTAETEVNRDITAYARFREVKVYTITATYYYEYGDPNNPSTNLFETKIVEVEGQDLP